MPNEKGPIDYVGVYRGLPQFTNHADWFLTFLRNTDQKARQVEHLTSGLQSKYPEVWGRVIDPAYDLRVLLTGAGAGTSEISFLGRIQQIRDRRLDNVAVYYQDPSPQMQTEFQEAIAIAEVDTPVEYRGTIFEDPAYLPPEVDVAVGFQMWQYVKGWQGVPVETNSLAKFASTIQNRNGVAVLAVGSISSDNQTLRRKYLPVIHGGPNEVTSEDITAELVTLGISYDHVLCDSTLDIRSMFEDSHFKPTVEGENLLSFILRTRWGGVSPDLKEEVARDITQIVEKSKRGQTLTFRDGYVWIPASSKKVG